ncbi:MAG: endonuclease/exonuclease/phosphatase family protein [Clostridium sp.]|nr:endonuclease/exonuclease/phosphatase family protein [Clostridium sp.]MCM1547206.1 endonuclease/exonuclease/phosphatase family protein [Ruminococcus sp.]
MKLLTLNTHSIIEENYEKKLEIFIEAISRHKPDIIAMQEVNQTADGLPVSENEISGYFPAQSKIRMTADNHAYRVYEALRKKGVFYRFTWLPIKNGYKKFDEGLAVFSREAIVKADSFLISGIDDYRNWKTRYALGIMTENKNMGWFYSAHFSWWDDKDELFSHQWERLSDHFRSDERIWLMGDFNNPAEIRNEGYDLIKSRGWYDVYELSEQKDGGITVNGIIDGWRDKISSSYGMRIDQIWTNKPVSVKSTDVIFDGKNEAVISDHFGVMALIGDE